MDAGENLILPFGNHCQDVEAGTPKLSVAAAFARFRDSMSRNAYALNESTQPDLKEVWELIHQQTVVGFGYASLDSFTIRCHDGDAAVAVALSELLQAAGQIRGSTAGLTGLDGSEHIT